MLKQFEILWESWLNRLIVALLVIVIFDNWNRQNGGNNAATEHEPVTMSPPNETQSRSRLLEAAEEERKAGESKTKAEVHDQADEINEVEQFRESSDRQEVEQGKPLHQEETILADDSVVHQSNTVETEKRIDTKVNDPPAIKATSSDHPGMGHFNYWLDIECSLFRIYTLGRRDNVEVAPPYVPHSYRGTVPIFLHVTNTTNIHLKVYWIDYKGKAIAKGDLRPNYFWTQTTWIDHPWVFENAETGKVVLYYIPYRVIPTSHGINTIADDGTGQHKFSIVPSKDENGPFWVSIRDDVLPFPGSDNFYSPLPAISWTLQHMSRLMSPEDTSITTLQKYLKNIIENPGNTKYRQIRIRSKVFAAIWQSPMKGLLLAVGFVEQEAYAELGSSDELPRERVQDLALLSYMLNKWCEDELQQSALQQPDGADGFGRQGFGRAGQMN